MIALPASAADEQVAWQAEVPSTTFFAGDWINVSVHGPRPAPVAFLYFNLSDPNGTLIDQQYKQVVNGTANYTFLLPLSSPVGPYILNCSANGTLIMQAGLTVKYDELNYLSKIVAFQQKQIADLQLTNDVQRLQLRDHEAKIAWYWLIPIEVALLFIVSGWWLWTIVLPTWRLVFEWYYPLDIHLDKQMTARVRGLTWLLGRFGPSDFRGFYARLRVNRLPVETDPVYRALRRARGLPELEIPHDMQLPESPPPQKFRVARKERDPP